METYKICYYQNEKPRYFVFSARDKHEANKKWNEFLLEQQTEIVDFWTGKKRFKKLDIKIYWSGLLDDWTNLQDKLFNNRFYGIL